MDLDTKSGAHNAAGFKLELSPWDNRNLIAAGYHKTDALDEVLRRDATPWICEFRKNGTQIISNLRWPAPSQDFSLHGGDVLSTFGDQQPYVFCQEMFSFRSDLEGIVFLSPIWTEGDNNFHLELTTTQETIATSCLTQVPIDIKEWPKPRRLEALTINEIVYEFEHPNYIPQTNFNDHNSFCDVDDQYQYLDGRSVVTTDDSRLTENAEINASLELNVSPNPSSTFVNVTVIGEKLNGHLELMNTMGQIIYTSELLTGSYYRSEIDITLFEEGIYFLRYTNGDDQLIKKVVKN